VVLGHQQCWIIDMFPGISNALCSRDALVFAQGSPLSDSALRLIIEEVARATLAIDRAAQIMKEG
jgi:hypothetical protein